MSIPHQRSLPSIAASLRWCPWLALLLAPPALAVEHDVVVNGHSFVPAELVIQVGDSVRWSNSSEVRHNVVADDESFRCANGCGEGGEGGYGGTPGPGDPDTFWSTTIVFGQAGDVPYHCEAHGAPGGIGMSGRILVQAAPIEDPPFAINFGLTGPWYNPATSGQGFYVDVIPSTDPPLIAVAWFSFDTIAGGADSQRWFTGIGSFAPDSDRVALSVLRTTGGRFGQAPPAGQATAAIGSAELVFAGCDSAHFSYAIDVAEAEQPPRPLQGEITLRRATPDVLCADLSQPLD